MPPFSRTAVIAVFLFLHAGRLDVAHPCGGRLAVEAPLPEELVAVLARLRSACGVRA
jgi:hypothetical protein